MTTIEEFSEQFFQDVVGRSQANGTYMEEEFFEVAREYIEDVGDLEEATFAPYSSLRGS